MKRLTLIAISLLFVAANALASPQAPNAPDPQTLTHHLTHQAATLSTPNGRVTLYAPAAQTSFSGAVVVDPAGTTEAERQSNTAVLNGYVIDVGGQRTRAGSGVLRWTIPAAGAAALPLILRDGSGAAVASKTLWPPQSLLQPRGIYTAGQGVPLSGRFDGDFAGTRPYVDGVAARPLLETADTLVVEIPQIAPGSHTIQVTENGQPAASSEIRVVSIAISAPKTQLRPGETSPMQIRVEGLAGIDRACELTLANGSPIHVSMAGGNVQSVAIQPIEIRGDGSFQLARTLTGVSAGEYTISASIDMPQCLLCAMDDDPCKKLRDDATAKEQEARDKIVQAGELDSAAENAKSGGGPSAWDRKAKGHDDRAAENEKRAAAHDKKAADYDKNKRPKHAAQERERAASARDAAKAEKDKGAEARDTAKKLRDNKVPDDNPKTHADETRDAAKKLEADAKRLREQAARLEAEAKALREQARKCEQDQKKEAAKKKGK